MKKIIKEVLSNGYILGTVHYQREANIYNRDTDEHEIKKFREAISKSLSQIQSLKRENPELVEYLCAQELMISDPNLEKAVIESIQKDSRSAADAVRYVLDGYILGLSESSSVYLQERAADVEDIGQRIASNMEHTVSAMELHPYILAVDTLYPSFLIANRKNILGVIAKTGGYTSHTAILCRLWDIPFILSDEEFREGDVIIMDTGKKLIILNPSSEETEEYSRDLTKRLSFDKQAIPHGDYLFLANISSNTDLPKVMDYGFDGVGLYRTEMIFMNTQRPYSFQEQYEIYKECVEKMKGRYVCFRTFDVGDDKQLPYLKAYKKGIDNYKNNPILFIEQIKALLKANIYGNIRIMFPMIETKEEFLYLKRWVLKIREENHFNMPRIGMMLETKEALQHIGDFEEADFISIGTNDLTAQLYHVNRDTALENFEEYVQDLTERLSKVVSFCQKHDICLSVCGELASVRKAALLFYTIGIKNLSVAPSAIRMLNLAYSDYADK